MAIINGDDLGNNLFGTNDDDQYFGLGGFDLLFASLGNDTLDGGSDTDVAIYDVGLFTNGVFINNTDTAIGTVLARTVDKRGFGTDTLVDVSNYHGTNFGDTIYIGGSGGTYSFDRAGDDYVEASQDPNAGADHYFGAGSGNDTLVGTVNRDRVDYSDNGGDGTGAVIQGIDVDLAAGTATDGWGDSDTLIGIERVTGTQFDDTIRGDEGRNDFEGLQGNDVLDGRGGDRDRAEYQNDPAAVTVDLGAGTATDGWGNTDTLIGIEQARGSQFGDTLLGSAARDGFQGQGGDDLIQAFGGDDFLEGDQGNDTLDGGDGRDNVGFFDDPSGVDVDLAAGTATDGWGDADTLISIEEIDGSSFGDTLRGTDGDNFIDGREGDDLLEGRGGEYDTFRGSQGNDTIDGGEGTDRAEYHRDAERGGAAGVTVDLAAGTATDGFGDTDTLISIEDVRATQFDDTLIGNDDTNRFLPGEGSDSIVGGLDTNPNQSQGDELDYQDLESGGITVTLTGGGEGTVAKVSGSDTFSGIEEVFGTNFDDLITGDAEAEWLGGQGGNDTIIGNDGNDDLSGGDGDDLLDGGVGGDFLQPGAGNDTVIGGPDGPLFETDELSYGFDRDAASGVAVTFSSEFDGTVVDWSGGTDSFTGIERVRGTGFDDTFTGAEGRQIFRGLGGDDAFDGGAGDEDQVDYSRAADDTGAVQGVNVSLAAGGGTDANGDTDTFANIEQIRGSQFDDTIVGDANRNRLEGEDGNDLLDSFGGADNELNGGRGNDTIEARGDNDFATGDDGNDLITFHGEGGGANPGLGSDTIVGGTEGFFSINYFGVGADLVIDTALGTTTFVGGPDVDIFSNIRNLEGGFGNDTLLGDDLEEFQRFRTSQGDDFIDGRGGFDQIEYDDRNETSVVVDFITGTVTGAWAGTDTFQNIEEARGSDGDDTFIGNDDDNRFQGMDGVDDYDGNGGFDSISFSGDRFNGGTLAVTVDLAAGTNTDGWGNSETNTEIERVVATDFDDTLFGAEYDDRLIGIMGDDILDARGGDDGLYGGGGIDTVTGGAGADAFGGRVWELDGDTFTDFGAEDRLQVFDDDFNLIGANVTIVGSEMRIDTTGDGIAEATVTLTNGFAGPVNVEGGPVGGPVPAKISVANAGLFTAAVQEADQTIEVTLTRSGDIFSTATVNVTVTGHGANPADAVDIASPFGTPQTVTFLPGETTATVTVDIAGDADIEPTEDLTVTLSNPVADGTAGAELGGAQTFIRIINDDFPSSVSITGEKSPEDTGQITFTVSRTGDTSDAITVPYQIASAGGLQGAEADDLVGGLPQSGSVVIAAGASQATFSIAVAPDAVAELHDDIIATISVGADWPAGLSVGIAQATGSIRNDDGVPPDLPIGSTGSNYGDPHLVTLDGLAYDFQAVGEFTLIEAVVGDPLEVQVRFQPVDGSQVASQTTALSTVLGTARVVIDATGSSLVTVDGVAFDIGSAVGGTALGDGEIYYDGEAITLVYASGEQVRADLFDGFLSTSVSIAVGRDVRGLLGNADGDQTNDLALRDGTVLSQPVSFADLYGVFADDWRVSDATSLFDYAAGQGTADFTDTGFPAAGVTLADFPVEVVAAAEAVASGIADPALKQAAILDYLVSGNADYIEAATRVDDTLEAPLAKAEPTDAPGIFSGIGIAVSDSEITEGDSGSQSVTFTIYRTGDLSQSVDLSYAVGGTVDGADVSGAMSGDLGFAAGEASREVTLAVLGDTLAEDNETLEMSFSLTGAAQPLILSSKARVDIVNDDLTPTEPELNPIVGTDRSDLLIGTDAADLITSYGGRFDLMFGGAGADVFEFGEEMTGGKRDRDVILDYEVGVDQILLTGGAEIAQIRDSLGGAKVIFEGGRDILYVRGDGVDAENLTIVVDEFDLV